MNHVDLKYCGILSSRLEQYTVKSHLPYRANFRCAMCGDSEKSKLKKRGWLLEKNNTAFYYCHNCGYKGHLGQFLQDYSPPLGDEYLTETFLDRKSHKRPPKKTGLETLKMSPPKFRRSDSHLKRIKRISQLKVDHPARRYVESRKIPTEKHYMLYYAPAFVKWTNSIIPGKLEERSRDEPRLIIPFLDHKGHMFGFAGRSFDPKASLRYITIMIDEDMPKIFGLNMVDFTKDYYVVEGQIDSLYLKNACAMAGSDGSIAGLQNDDNAVFVYDNEPRNKAIVGKMEKVIRRGNKIVIWPHYLLDNDIGDMIQTRTSPEIEKIMRQCTFSGPEAELELSMWRKC